MATVLEPPPPRARTEAATPFNRGSAFVRWLVVLAVPAVVLIIPAPPGVATNGWRLFAIFSATIVAMILQPLPIGAVVLLGVSAVAVFGVLPPAMALAGYADPIVWLVLCAFFIARGVINTGLGRRIGFVFIRIFGRTSLGLGYSLVITDALLAMVIPSTGARSGGIIFPTARSIAEAYDSHPGESARKLGAFLMALIYQCEVIICAMFLTGQASNPLIAGFVKQVTGVELSYTRWMVGAIVPGILSLIVIPLLVYRVYPPDVRRTPDAPRMASEELGRMGPMGLKEKLMLATLVTILLLWLTISFHKIDYAVVALLGVCLLLGTNVLSWSDLLSERPAWDVFIWYGGLLALAKALGASGITKWFAGWAAGFAGGWSWGAALVLLLLIYFYVAYAFASITAHATAMYVPFLVVLLAAGTPTYVAILTLAYLSNLSASLTHYGTTPAPIYFGAGYIPQRTWWKLGFLTSIPNLLIWTVVGLAWWKLLGWW
jgi:divalent anion:Na+ symporter, DASS family